MCYSVVTTSSLKLLHGCRFLEVEGNISRTEHSFLGPKSAAKNLVLA